MNKVTLLGNLTQDIEMAYSQSGTGYAKTAIAVNNRRKKEEVLYIDIVFFNQVAEIANKYLRKGSKLCIHGRLEFNQWSDQNGNKRQKHTIIVEDLEMLSSSSNQTIAESNTPKEHKNFPKPKYTPYNTPTIEINEDEIPF